MEHQSPWRNPVIWLLVLLPLAAVVGGIAMVVVASRSSGNNDVVTDRVSRTGQIQQAATGPDEVAMARRLSLVLRSEDGVVEAFPATGDFDRTVPLRLLFEHPSDSSLDVTVLLAPTPTGWRAEAAVPAGHHWNLSAADAARTWRLKGRMDKAGHAARLAPALRAEP
ncbi:MULTISPECIES: FixH family protein [Thermomonas]|uniref:FixH family protein n=1 Tax=Thermomonas TaxID=141948 RepID=UPI0023070002|nr:FixH family protein [Thermomonas mangrovi]